MKLITHNMLSCHIKGVTNGYPFKIQADKVLLQVKFGMFEVSLPPSEAPRICTHKLCRYCRL